MAELRSGTQFRLKLEIVPLKSSRKRTKNVYLHFVKDCTLLKIALLKILN